MQVEPADCMLLHEFCDADVLEAAIFINALLDFVEQSIDCHTWAAFNVRKFHLESRPEDVVLPLKLGELFFRPAKNNIFISSSLDDAVIENYLWVMT